MNKEYGYTKQAESNHQGSRHTLAILLSKLRSSLEAAWSKARVRLEYAYSMLMTTFLRPFSSKRAELERRLASDEITARPSRDYGSSLTRLRLVVSMLLLLIVGIGNVWGQSPVEITTDTNGNGTIENSEKKFYLIQTNAFPSFYMAPKNNSVMTNNILGDYMLWYFLDAGTDDEIQYYYIVNNSTENCIYNSSDRSITLTNLANLSNEDKEKCKFKLVLDNSDNTTDFYNIDLKGRSGNEYYGLNKQNGSANDSNPIRLTNDQYIHDPNSKWKFVPFNGTYVWPTRPFNPSTDSDKHFYKISNVNSGGFYVSTDAAPDKVTYASTETDRMVWYLKEAPNDPSEPWYKYYYIINPSTGGRYMYYNGTATNGSNQTTAVSVKGYNSENEDRYQFAVIQTARGDGSSRVTCYAIIPKLLKDQFWGSNSIGSASVSDGANMGIIKSRGATNAQWKFEVTDYSTACANPTITFSNTTGKVTITTTTSTPSIYYTTDGTEPSSTNGELYSEPFDVTEETTIKAIVTRAGFTDSGVTTKTIYKVATPSIQDNGNYAVSITSETEGATIYYTTDDSNPNTLSTEYTAPLTENISGVLIKAIAVKDGMINSAIGSGAVTLSCATPVFTKSGDYISISCPFPATGVTIYYTKNGGAPTSSSAKYTDPIQVVTGDVIKAIAVATGYNNSEVAIKTVYDELEPIDGKYYINNQTDFEVFVDMASTTAGATYHYILQTNVDAGSSITIPFSGTFDGGGYTISGLSHPLFNTVNGGVVKNVMLKNVQISGSGNVGAIAGETSGYTRIYNCGILPSNNKYENESSYVSSSGGNCGGLVGLLNDDSRVINCFSYANITGGSTVAGIVGYNNFASTAEESAGKYTKLKTAVVNCMFYGNITSGTTRYPVYGGKKILNNTATGINNYDFYRAEAKLGLADNDHYNCSWPAQEEYLTKYEYYRYLLNSNRELCGWWVGAPSAPSEMSKAEVQDVPKDASMMAKWVLDPSIAPYPILKAPGFYPSAVNHSPRPDETNPKRIDPETKEWVSRASSTNTKMVNPKAAPETDGRSLGKITVKIKKNANDNSTDKEIIITAMDIDNNDFSYGKIQLPYYNSIFGNPAVQIDPTATDQEKANQWDSRYGGNYKDKVVVGWEITDVGGGTSGNFIKEDTEEVKAWESGFNFADRNCTDKDKERVFAQGGYYYVPYGVYEITITAKWADAIYLDNSANNSYDRVYMSGDAAGTDFAPAGYRPTTLGNGKTVQTGTVSSILPTNNDVYNKAIVLVGNHQYRTGNANLGDKAKGCTILSADFDLDDEPDYSLIWQLGNQTSRYNICPIRFDFLPVIEMGMAMKEDGSTQYYSLGCYRPLGHFEVTETSLIHFGQFEFGNQNRSLEAPLILNGGIYDQFTKGTGVGNADKDDINYMIIGGNVYMPSFAPGAHVNGDANYSTRHCAVNILGGRINNLYLTGNFNNNVTPNTDNPHCYIDGGNFKQVAAAGKEGINGDVFFKINHSVIEEFYGGSTMDQSTGDNFKTVKGNINVTVDNSKITKYCGGPKFGNMNLDEDTPANNKTVTTNATGTTFGVYYGGGNGGTSYVQYAKTDVTETNAQNPYDWNSGSKGNLNSYSPNTYRSGDKNYMADYEMEIVNSSAGTDANKGIFRTYFFAAQFSATNTGPITNNLTDCKVLTSFYGGGNLGGVIGDVESTLTDTEVMGSAFGAGYSASVPEVTIYNKDKTAPTLNVYTGIITPTPDPDTKSTHETYTWCYKNKTTNVVIPSGVVIPNGVGTSNPTFEYGGKKYFYTEESLENLGTVTGKATLNINGTTTIGKSVYGGGEESGVAGNTEVTVTGGTIGTPNLGGAEYGNVYGGGKGKADDVTAGIVKGSTNVSISGSPTILHNVYGGGAYGSVGTFSYDDSGFPTGWTTTDDKGKCTVSITGGTIGTTGDNNGMVFGSSRGLEGDPSNPNVDKMAWVYDTDVTIGTQSSETGPSVKGSVYGGGENGHNFHNANVTVHSGTIGILEGAEIIDDRGTPGDTSDDISYTGARFPNRGNVYGSGCGTDTYTANSKTYFDFNAGIVRGNTTVDIKGGHVVHNVYGGGAMGSVGTYTFDVNGKPIFCADGTGTCTVTVSGGQIGVTGAKMAGYGKGGPDDYGHVFGAGRGEMHDPNLYPNVETCAFFNKTILNISGTAFLTGSVYGGSESGHVLGDTEVNIAGGQIGCGKDSSGPFNDAVWADDYTPTGDNMDCASWPFESPFAPYDPFANATGDLDKYLNGKSTDGGRLEASDGHTYYGNVFGGGSGCIPYFDTTEGISKYLSTAGSVEGKTTINISGGHIITNVYGGCEATNVKGSATITMTGGTVGVPRTVAQIMAHPNTGYIFGAGKGDQRIFFNKETNVDRTLVNIEGGRVYGSIFGGGEDGHVFQNAIVNIGKAGTEGPTIGTSGTSYVDGNVFGGGRGFGGEALTAGNIGGSIELNIKSGKILGSVYGGGRLGSVGYGLYLVDEEIEEGGEKIKPYGILRPNDKYDGSYPNPSTQEASVYYDKGRGYITINITGGTIGNDHEYIYNPTTEQKAAIPNTTFDYQNHLQYTKGGNVFTGGMGRLYALDNTTLLPLWPKLGKCKGTTLNMTGGTVKSSIYGGGEIGAVAENATVNVNGGTVGTKVVDPNDATKYYYFGSVFGGGKGSVDNITYPSTTPEADKIPISEAGTTGGNVAVNLNEGVAENKKGAIVSQVFGCNDMNGSPKGTVTVHVYATQNADKANISTKPDKDKDTYDVMAVYGGGNLAAYEPTDLSTGKTNVIIDGCGLTSVRQVYGGGNAASTPATDVEINGSYEILELFGGGNGADKLPTGADNPGANVGYKDYHLVENAPAYATKEARTEGAAFAPYRYGTGEATVNIKGGTIHRVFGGSNTKGNVRKTALTLLEELQSGGVPVCPFHVDEAYGGGKSAPMDAEAQLHMACIPGLKEAYGGAEAADIQGDVTLNITNGTFDRVFGGNNISGTIRGSIKVNIEEVGCKPIIIGELYGGGNQAGYSVYGYDGDGKPIESGNTPLFADPVVNVRSFTSIGSVYGGGYGETAVMVGNPTVNINVGMGGQTNHDAAEIPEGTKLSDTYPIPSHIKGKIGAINNVYGGGNAAKVLGDATVNIGVTDAETLTTVTNDPATPVDESKLTVVGADIRGNVYGGGNNAEVTGDTNVTIGKKNE